MHGTDGWGCEPGMVVRRFLLVLLVIAVWGCDRRRHSPGDQPGPRSDAQPAGSHAARSHAGQIRKQPRVTFPPLHRLTPAPPLQKGVALGLFSEDSGWSYAPLLREIKALGASHVSLISAYYLDNVRAVRIFAHPRYSAPDQVLRRTIRQARKLGLAVMLFPILRVAHKPTPDDWRGNLAPSDPIALQRSYKKLMVRLARLAQEEHVAIFSVGSEMSSLDGIQDGRWFAPVIQAVRKVYKGPLLYSANWDHYDKTRLWGLVDLAGLCAYFGLTDSGRPRLVEMLAGWKTHRRRIVAWSRQVKKPFVFTEVGYPSQVGAAREPWNEGARRTLDLDQQRRAYEAFVRTWNHVSSLKGVYFWNWYGWGGPRDRSYTPRRKPASQVIAWWYGGRWPMTWWFPK